MADPLSQLAAASRNWIGDSPTGAMTAATRAFVSTASTDEALIRHAAASLPGQSPGSVAWIAVALGAVVERGAPAELSGPAVLEALQSWLPKLPTPADAESPPTVPTPAQAMLLGPFQYLCRAAVTHLARLPALRETLGGDAALVERMAELGAWSHGAWWVREALLKTSGTLVVLHPPSGSGLRLAYRNVSNGFHLFSLLQTAVGTRIPGGREPDAAIAAVARGQSSSAVDDEAWWHYGTAASPQADANASVWGEGPVRDIPRVNGEAVILLWPPILASRRWDSGFLGPHLEAMPADASIERMLTADEAGAWLERLGITRRRRPWWRRLASR